MNMAPSQHQQSRHPQDKYTTAVPPAPRVPATYEEMAEMARNLYSAPLKVRDDSPFGTRNAHAFLHAFEELRAIVDHGTSGLKSARANARTGYYQVQWHIARGELILGGGQC